MAGKDLLFVLLIAPLVLGVIALCFSYVDVTSISLVSQSFNQTYNATGLQKIPGIQSLSNNLYQLSFFWPDMAALMCIIMVAEAWLLSFFIKASPLASVIASVQLLLYTAASFYVSNIAITVGRLSIFSTLLPHANLLLLLWLNMPPILFLCSVIDIGISVVAATR